MLTVRGQCAPSPRRVMPSWRSTLRAPWRRFYRNLGNEEARSAVLILESSIGVTYQVRPFVPENPAQASGFLLVSAWY